MVGITLAVILGRLGWGAARRDYLAVILGRLGWGVAGYGRGKRGLTITLDNRRGPAQLQKRKYNSDLSHRWKRKSLRMKTHNYKWTGTYFVTIRAVQREPIFETPELRAILTETWQTLPERFPSVTLDEFVIMPDHIHFIIWIEGNVEKPASLGDVIGAYKSLTAIAWLRHIKATGMECSARIWQHNYHEHAIRDNEELEQKRQYIRDNPIKSKKHKETQ